MPRSLLRIVSLLLVPCLLADPALAHVALDFSAPQVIAVQPQLSIFQSQALSEPALPHKKILLGHQAILGAVLLALGAVSYGTPLAPQQLFAQDRPSAVLPQQSPKPKPVIIPWTGAPISGTYVSKPVLYTEQRLTGIKDFSNFVWMNISVSGAKTPGMARLIFYKKSSSTRGNPPPFAYASFDGFEEVIEVSQPDLPSYPFTLRIRLADVPKFPDNLDPDVMAGDIYISFASGIDKPASGFTIEQIELEPLYDLPRQPEAQPGRPPQSQAPVAVPRPAEGRRFPGLEGHQRNRRDDVANPFERERVRKGRLHPGKTTPRVAGFPTETVRRMDDALYESRRSASTGSTDQAAALEIIHAEFPGRSFTDKEKAVLVYLINLGVTRIGYVIKSQPRLLQFSLEFKIQPKVDYLKSLGIKDMGHVIDMAPSLLTYGLETTYKPLVAYLQSLEVADIGNVIELNPRMIGPNLDAVIKPAVAYFQSLGVRDLGRFIKINPSVTMRNLELIKLQTLYLQNLGVKNVGLIYETTPRVASGFNNAESVVAYLRSLGIVNVGRVIEMTPTLLVLNLENNIKPIVDYLKTLGVTDIVHLIEKRPEVLTLSLENNIKPTVAYLQSKGIQDIGDVIQSAPAILTYSVETKLDPTLRILLAIRKDSRLNGKEFNSLLISNLRTLEILWEEGENRNVVFKVDKFTAISQALVKSLKALTGLTAAAALRSARKEGKTEVTEELIRDLARNHLDRYYPASSPRREVIESNGGIKEVWLLGWAMTQLAPYIGFAPAVVSTIILLSLALRPEWFRFSNRRQPFLKSQARFLTMA